MGDVHDMVRNDPRVKVASPAGHAGGGFYTGMQAMRQGMDSNILSQIIVEHLLSLIRGRFTHFTKMIGITRDEWKKVLRLTLNDLRAFCGLTAHSQGAAFRAVYENPYFVQGFVDSQS